MKTSIFIFLMSFGLNTVSAQSNMLSPVQIEEDVNVFITALKKAHPGLDVYLNQFQLDSLFEELKVNQEEMELKDFYTSLLKTVTSIGDGHTDLYEGKLFREIYPYLESTMPFEFCIVNKDIYVSKFYDNTFGISKYSQVSSINGKPSDEILEILYSLTPADGHNTGFKEAYNEKILSRQFAKLIEFSEEYTIVIEHPDNSIKTINVNGVHDSIIHKNYYDKTPLNFELNKSDNYAILTANTFQYRLIVEGGFDYHKFLEQSFEELKKSKVENLIIDLRENYGGDNILAITLYSYLTDGQFKAMSSSLTKLHDTISVSPYSNFPKGNYPFERTHEIKPIENGFYELNNGIDSKALYNSDFIYKGPNKKAENISKNKFDGTIYCLTSGLTFSAAANFSTLLSRNENVLFIGQETGGANGIFCGGGFYTVTLPNSQFVLQIPFMRRCVEGLEVAEQGFRIIPDYTIDKDIESMKKGEDNGLTKAKELIKTTPNKTYKQ
jgi:C-terminal processing protease CtpA/Prc